jgi:hypothetical protein
MMHVASGGQPFRQDTVNLIVVAYDVPVLAMYGRTLGNRNAVSAIVAKQGSRQEAKGPDTSYG